MLSQQDFNMIESMVVRVVGAALSANNEEMKAYIDERFKQNNKEMKAYIDERFEQNNEEMKAYMDERFEQNNEEMRAFVKECVKDAIKESESFLLDEIDRYYNFSKRDIQKLSAKVDSIANYYRIRKNEDRQFEYVMRLYYKQQREIDEIKQVLAM